MFFGGDAANSSVLETVRSSGFSVTSWTVRAMADVAPTFLGACAPVCVCSVCVSVHDSAAISRYQVSERGDCHWCMVAVYFVALLL